MCPCPARRIIKNHGAPDDENQGTHGGVPSSCAPHNQNHGAPNDQKPPVGAHPCVCPRPVRRIIKNHGAPDDENQGTHGGVPLHQDQPHNLCKTRVPAPCTPHNQKSWCGRRLKPGHTRGCAPTQNQPRNHATRVCPRPARRIIKIMVRRTIKTWAHTGVCPCPARRIIKTRMRRTMKTTRRGTPLCVPAPCAPHNQKSGCAERSKTTRRGTPLCVPAPCAPHNQNQGAPDDQKSGHTQGCAPTQNQPRNHAIRTFASPYAPHNQNHGAPDDQNQGTHGGVPLHKN